MRKIAIVLCIFFLTGCGSATKHYLKNNPNAIPVNFTVDLDKDFVKSVSTIGGGQAAMLILVGPFSNNAVLLEAKELSSIGERMAFHQRIKWGVTEFTTYLEKNRSYDLTVMIQGTRTGMKKIGSIDVGGDFGQNFLVTLHGQEIGVK